MVDRPDNLRKLHKKPTPPAGGIVLFILFLYLQTFYSFITLNKFSFYALVVLFLIGFLDDIIELAVLLKLIAQLLFALVLSLENINGILSLILSVLFYVSFINSVNFIDNSSGVCLSFLMFAFLFIYTFTFNEIFFYYLIAVIALLILNLPYEKLFLGNSGTYFTGGFLIVVVNEFLGKTLNVNNNYLYSVLDTGKNLFFLFTPFIDFFVTIVRRMYRGYPIYKGDNRHLSFILEKFFKSKEIALVFWVLFLYCILLANIIFIKDNIPYIYSSSK